MSLQTPVERSSRLSDSTRGVGCIDRRQPMDLAVGHRADLAEILGDDEIGRQPAQRLRVDGDDRAARLAQPPHLGIDGRARAAMDRSAWR